jgi:hypothetical protein
MFYAFFCCGCAAIAFVHAALPHKKTHISGSAAKQGQKKYNGVVSKGNHVNIFLLRLCRKIKTK